MRWRWEAADVSAKENCVKVYREYDDVVEGWLWTAECGLHGGSMRDTFAEAIAWAQKHACTLHNRTPLLELHGVTRYQIDEETRQWMQGRIDDTYEDAYSGGLHGTCWECPFGSEPLDADGRTADVEEWHNDPTEAYFRCSLPGRENRVEWGEYAPCTDDEYRAAIANSYRDRAR